MKKSMKIENFKISIFFGDFECPVVTAVLKRMRPPKSTGVLLANPTRPSPHSMARSNLHRSVAGPCAAVIVYKPGSYSLWSYCSDCIDPWSILNLWNFSTFRLLTHSSISVIIYFHSARPPLALPLPGERLRRWGHLALPTLDIQKNKHW